MGVALFANKANLHRERQVIARRALPAAGEILIVKVGRLVHVKVDVNSLLRYQRGQYAGAVAGGDQVTAGDQRAAGAAIDRRGHFGEVEVELRGINRRLCRANIGLRLGSGGTALLPLFAGNQVGID